MSDPVRSIVPSSSVGSIILQDDPMNNASSNGQVITNDDPIVQDDGNSTSTNLSDFSDSQVDTLSGQNIGNVINQDDNSTQTDISAQSDQKFTQPENSTNTNENEIEKNSTQTEEPNPTNSEMPSPKPDSPITPMPPTPPTPPKTPRVKKSAQAELDELREKIDTSSAPDELKERMHTMCDRLEKMVTTGIFSREYDILSNYIYWVTSFPWGNYATEVLDLDAVKKELDDNHYGLENIKERVLQYMAVRKLLTDKKDFEAVKRSPVICMVGLQGIGKTTLAKSMAKALKRPFYRISMGAIGSVLEIRGRDKAIEGAEPGQIIKAIIRSGVRNPIILLDELDKASGQAGLLADVMATMLEILDPEQNTTYRDHFFDFPVDLSEVMFVVSANKMGTFSAALLDRMEVIKMPSYTDEEKMVIARDYLLPRVQASTGILQDQLEFSPDVWPLIIRPLGFDSGIRSLQRMLENMSRKVALEIVTGKTNKVYITPQNFKEYLPRY